MSTARFPALLPLAALALAAATSPVLAQQLPIINPGFDDLVGTLNPGELTNGAGGLGVPVAVRATRTTAPNFNVTVQIPGWRTFLNPGATVNAGVLNPNFLFGGQPYLAGYSGPFVGTAQNASLQQTLPVRVRPAMHYRLSFLAGVGRGDSYTSAPVRLLAVPTPNTLAFFGDNVNTFLLTPALANRFPNDAVGELRPYFIEYTSPDPLPAHLQGKYLAIAFNGSDGIPRVCYDDFVLTATPAGACNPADVAEVGGTAEAPGPRDGQLTVDDIIVFVNLFSGDPGCPLPTPEIAQACGRSDLTAIGGLPQPPDGQLTVDDIIAFVNAFGDGC